METDASRRQAGDHAHVIYQWFTSADFLLPALWPSATVLDADPHDRADSVLARVPPGCAWFHFHLNCTQTARFPRCRTELNAALRDRGIEVVNGEVTDISKRRIQAVCADVGLPATAAPRAGDPDMLLIVKTDLNFGGASEWGIAEDDRRDLGIGPGSDLIWKPDHYLVVPRREVEPQWWEDPSLVIERFIDNESHRWYRGFLMLSTCFLCEFVNPNTIKKVGDSRLSGCWRASLSAEGESVEGVPGTVIDQLRRFVPRFELQFGAVDFVVDGQGQPYLIDVNTTPAYNHPVPGLIEALREGIRSNG